MCVCLHKVFYSDSVKVIFTYDFSVFIFYREQKSLKIWALKQILKKTLIGLCGNEVIEVTCNM